MNEMTPSVVVTAEPFAVADPTLCGFTHRYATVEGVRMHYVSGGNPQGKVLLLLAGFPQTWYAWRNVMNALAQDFWLVAPDRPVRVIRTARRPVTTHKVWRRKSTG